MVIGFICNYIYINGGWSPWSTRIGGSEEMIVETAKRLHERGHSVTVYHNGQHGNYNGVLYKDHAEFVGCDVLINLNYPEFNCATPQILWTSLTQHPDLSHFKAVCAISQYAKEHTGIQHPCTYIVPPGFNENVIKPGKKVIRQCFYASSPDRGLDTLIEVWPNVAKAYPDAMCLVTYGANPPETVPPNMIFLGELSEDEMNDIYATSDFWLHPCSGGELYCMTGVKAQAAGCVPVVIPTMALAETVRHGVFANKEDYGDALIEALSYPEAVIRVRNKLTMERYPTWEDSTDKLEEIIKKVYNDRQ